MAIIQDWLPPSRENWEFISRLWMFFPIMPILHHLLTSRPTATPPSARPTATSRPSLAQRIIQPFTTLLGTIILLYTLLSSPLSSTLPIGNYTLTALYTLHTLYHAFLSPSPTTLLYNPTNTNTSTTTNPSSTSAFHTGARAAANLYCGLSLGGWVAGYGKSSAEEWAGAAASIEVGLVMWGWSFLAMVLHDDEIRAWATHQRYLRDERERQLKYPQNPSTTTDAPPPKLPRSYLYRYLLYPHFLFSTINWLAFWIIAGFDCKPVRGLVVYEVADVVVRAIEGRGEVLRAFGREEVHGRWVLVPGLF